MIRSVLMAATTLAMSWVSAAEAGAAYSMYDVWGNSYDETYTTSINDHNDVTFWATTEDAEGHETGVFYLWSMSGGARAVATSPDGGTIGRVNNHGQVAAFRKGDADAFTSAIRWSEATGLEVLDTPTAAPGQTLRSFEAVGINNNGLVVGNGMIQSVIDSPYGPLGVQTMVVPYLWDTDGTVRALDVPPPQFSGPLYPPLNVDYRVIARAMNDAGDIVGYITTQGTGDFVPMRSFLSRAGGPAEVPAAWVALGDVSVRDINNLGQVVGSVQGPDGTRAFFWDPLLGVVDLGLGDLEGGFGSLNDKGEAIGLFGGRWAMWSASLGLSYLDEITALPANWQLREITDINAAGSIVGLALDEDYREHVVLLLRQAATDVPEPAALALLAGGLIGVVLVRRRRA